VRSFLRCTIYAPLASWGDPAVGEIRGSWDRPSRSAILGLVGAAFGVVRENDAGHSRLDSSLGVAVRLLASGEPLVDYHTTQNPKSSVVKKLKPVTRRIALALDEPTTALSRRWLRQDALYLVALWLRPNASIELEAISEALRSPSFTLYAGRKANVLGLPLDPSVVSAPSLAEALRDAPVLPEGLAVLRQGREWGTEVAHDPCEGFEPGLTPVRSVSRRDAAPVRSRWQFADRTVYVGRIPAGSPA
jgi:CRISPR system Cascade subunit CasD